MDLSNMTVREIQAALDKGTLKKEDVATIPGILGEGERRFLALSEPHKILWSKGFPVTLLETLREQSRDGLPELKKTAKAIGCDTKTLLKYCERELPNHPTRWKEVLAWLVEQGTEKGLGTDYSQT